MAKGNATQAYVEAIPKAAIWRRHSASRKAVDLLKQPSVRARIEALQELMVKTSDVTFAARLEEYFGRHHADNGLRNKHDHSRLWNRKLPSTDHPTINLMRRRCALARCCAASRRLRLKYAWAFGSGVYAAPRSKTGCSRAPYGFL